MGATKRMSNGEAKLDAPASQTTALFNGTFAGPHPSTIRVSAPYITQAAIEQRLQSAPGATGANLSLDAHERNLTQAREDSARLQGVTWLDSVRRALQLPIRTFTTACVYYHKFRLAHPSVEYNWVDAAAASLLTSCKNEDTLKKSRDILAAAYNMKQSAPHEHVSADDPMFEIPSRVAIGLERLVLESGAFDFRSRSPHHVLVKITSHLSRSLGESRRRELEEITQVAWIILTDIHRTFAPLKQTSATLAFTSLELAITLQDATASESAMLILEKMHASLADWHTSRQEVMETLLDTLDLYTHHTAATILGNRFTLDDFLRVRLALNKECAASELARFSIAQPASSDQSGNTLRVSNGHPTPVSPPQPGQATQQTSSVMPNHTIPEGGGTLRFMLNPQRSVDEKVEVNRYYIEEWEEYEEEIEVPVKSSSNRERSRDYHESSHHHRRPEAWPRPRDDRDRARDRLRDREYDAAERDRHLLRDRERDRRYDDRRYDERDRERDRHYDVRRDRDRQYYEDDSRRRPRNDRR